MDYSRKYEDLKVEELFLEGFCGSVLGHLKSTAYRGRAGIFQSNAQWYLHSDGNHVLLFCNN